MTGFADPGSFRDPAGRVYHVGRRVLRSVNARAAPYYEFVRDRGLLESWIERGWVIDTWETDPDVLPAPASGARYVLEHAPVPFISYPYEWPFQALKSAALRHLELQIDALGCDVQLSDASAYNIQFVGPHPIFIDVLSFRPYQPGDYWTAHRQFCEQFLYPLLLRAWLGIPPNAWYRGRLEGIPAADLTAVLPLRAKLSWNVWSHVTLPAWLAARAAEAATPPARPRRPLPRSSYAGLLDQLRRWIARLKPRQLRASAWSHYDAAPPYTPAETARKRAVVAEFVSHVRPRMVWDVGCNTGEYAELALSAGAAFAVGFDADHASLDRAFDRAVRADLNFLPLFLDAADPSSDKGWNQRERRGLKARGPADAVLALALLHHLAIGHNVPIEEAVSWLTSLAPAGVVEFVQKDDPTVRLMLSSREDVFEGYSESAFVAALTRCARIVRAETVSATGRRLFVYDRR